MKKLFLAAVAALALGACSGTPTDRLPGTQGDWLAFDLGGQTVVMTQAESGSPAATRLRAEFGSPFRVGAENDVWLREVTDKAQN